MAGSLPGSLGGLRLGGGDRERHRLLRTGAARHAPERLGQPALERERREPAEAAARTPSRARARSATRRAATPPTAGPTVKPTCHESAEIAM